MPTSTAIIMSHLRNGNGTLGVGLEDIEDNFLVFL